MEYKLWPLLVWASLWASVVYIGLARFGVGSFSFFWGWANNFVSELPYSRNATRVFYYLWLQMQVIHISFPLLFFCNRLHFVSCSRFSTFVQHIFLKFCIIMVKRNLKTNIWPALQLCKHRTYVVTASGCFMHPQITSTFHASLIYICSRALSKMQIFLTYTFSLQ